MPSNQFSGSIPAGLLSSTRLELSALSGPVLCDTARLSRRYPPIALWGFWCLNMTNRVRYPPPPFLSVSPLESMRSGGAIPPSQKGYLSDTRAIPYEKTRQMGAIPPSAILSRKGIARYGGVSRTGPQEVSAPKSCSFAANAVLSS